MKRIPTSFPLGSYTITVLTLEEDAFTKKTGGGCYGMFDPNALTIYLCKPPPRNKGAAQIAYQTFWHEYSHALLWASVRPKLYTDEKLVDNLGHLLAQLKDAKYD